MSTDTEGLPLICKCPSPIRRYAYQVEEYKITTDLISRAVGIDSDQSVFYINLGNVLQRRGKLEESIEAYQRAIHIQSDHKERYFQIATQHLISRHYPPYRRDHNCWLQNCPPGQ